MSLDLAPALAVAGLILVKESGVPVPVPGDLVVLGAGVAASRGDLDPTTTLAILVLASVAGGLVQYGLLRSVARPAVLALLARLGQAERITAQTDRLRHGGARTVALARITPGVRIVAIGASALADVPLPAFLGGLVVGNGLFIAAHFGLGYALGAPVVAIVGGALGTLALVGIALAVLGALGWFAIHRRRPASAGGASDAAGAAGILSWADACCPACLALSALERA
jgi:membrane-associated protein